MNIFGVAGLDFLHILYCS